MVSTKHFISAVLLRSTKASELGIIEPASNIAPFRPGDRIAWKGGIDKFWGGTRSLFCVNSRGAQGHEKFVPVWMKWTTWGAKSQRDFPAKIANSSGFSGRKQVIFKKKRSSFHKRHKIWCQSTKTLIWTSICAPEAPILLISSGHSLRLGGHNFRLGGHGPGMPPPRCAGSGPFQRNVAVVATSCPMWWARDLNFRSSTPKTKAMQLDQPIGF